MGTLKPLDRFVKYLLLQTLGIQTTWDGTYPCSGTLRGKTTKLVFEVISYYVVAHGQL
jgi:hypothetical protein